MNQHLTSVKRIFHFVTRLFKLVYAIFQSVPFNLNQNLLPLIFLIQRNRRIVQINKKYINVNSFHYSNVDIIIVGVRLDSVVMSSLKYLKNYKNLNRIIYGLKSRRIYLPFRRGSNDLLRYICTWTNLPS